MNIFARLRALEALTAALRADLDAVPQKIADAIGGAMRMHTACGRCGGLLDLTTYRPDGVRLVERTIEGELKRVPVCNWCEQVAKGQGWKRVKPDAAPPDHPPTVPTIPPAEQETAQ